MVITEKELLEVMLKRSILERYNTAIEKYFKDNELEDLVKEDFDFRRTIVETIVEDVNGRIPKVLIYAEYPNNIQELDKLGDSDEAKYLRDSVSQFLSYSARGLTINFNGLRQRLADINIRIPKELMEKDIILIGLRSIDDKKFTTFATHPFSESRNYFWTLVHEVFHNFPEFTYDEVYVEKKTFDWLLEYEYLDTIGINFVRYMLSSRQHEEVIDYMVNTLKKYDQDLLLNFLYSSLEVITDLEKDLATHGFQSKNVSTYYISKEEHAEHMKTELNIAFELVIKLIDSLGVNIEM